MKNIILFILGTILILASVSGCKKTIYGCTDFAAYNFNSAATVDNGSCLYEGHVTFFFANPTLTHITVSINGLTDSLTRCYQTMAPQCSDTGCATFLLPAGTYYYTARCTQKTWGITTPDSVIVIANNCQTYLLP